MFRLPPGRIKFATRHRPSHKHNDQWVSDEDKGKIVRKIAFAVEKKQMLRGKSLLLWRKSKMLRGKSLLLRRKSKCCAGNRFCRGGKAKCCGEIAFAVEEKRNP